MKFPTLHSAPYRHANPDDGDPGGGAPSDTDTDTGFEWPEDWRTQLAGDDEKALKQLERYEDPVAIWNKARALEQKITSGEYRQATPFPEDGSEEEQSEWRRMQGIPASPDQYQLAREVAEEEMAEIKPFIEYAHSKNLPPDIANTVIDYFYENSKRGEEAIAVADEAESEAIEDFLRAEWGDEYRRNQNKVRSVLDMVPDGGDALLEARLPDGTKLENSPAFQQFLLLAADAINPTLVVPSGGGDVMSSIMDEIDEIKAIMNTKEYTPQKRARYRDLLSELDRQGKLPEVPK